MGRGAGGDTMWREVLVERHTWERGAAGET